jgi:hypothetical protein
MAEPTDELIVYALGRLTRRGLLDKSPPPSLDVRTGSRGIRYLHIMQSSCELHMKVGNTTTVREFRHEVEAIAQTPDAVRPQLLDSFGLQEEGGDTWFIVQPFYRKVEFVNRSPFEQWTLVLAAADTAAALWSAGRLHLDLNSTVFFLDPAPPRVVLLDFNDVVPWPPIDGCAPVPRFYDGTHPDLPAVEPVRALHGTSGALGELAARLAGREEEFVSFALAHLLAHAAGFSGAVSTPARARTADKSLTQRFGVPAPLIAPVVAALDHNLPARPTLAVLRQTLAAGATALAGRFETALAEPLSLACAAYLARRGPIIGG